VIADGGPWVLGLMRNHDALRSPTCLKRLSRRIVFEAEGQVYRAGLGDRSRMGGWRRFSVCCRPPDVSVLEVFPFSIAGLVSPPRSGFLRCARKLIGLNSACRTFVWRRIGLRAVVPSSKHANRHRPFGAQQWSNGSVRSPYTVCWHGYRKIVAVILAALLEGVGEVTRAICKSRTVITSGPSARRHLVGFYAKASLACCMWRCRKLPWSAERL
jgi:hypothetical protein